MKDSSQVHDGKFEPCMQRKKRLEGPTTTLSSDFSNMKKINEEYILLGKNDKFQENVRYKYRSQAKNKENNLPSKRLQGQSEKPANEYVLLGNNVKFAHNIPYKLRPCPEVENVYDKENPAAKNKENNLASERLQDQSEKPDEYVLLGNNFKFAHNIPYKLRSCPEIENVYDKENPASDDEEDDARQSNSQEELSRLDEYILLGSNAKFADNVVYRPKTWHEYIPIYDTEMENKPTEDTEYFPVQGKNLEPAPFIDTSKFREPPQKLKKVVEKTGYSEVKNKEERRKARNGENVSAEKFVKFKSPPPARRSSPPSDTPAPCSPHPSDSSKDYDKKLLALLHKSGIHIPLEPCANQSEYQKNFTWKKPLPNSYTADENKRIFESVSILHADEAHPDPVPKLSEYQRNFQTWVPLSTNLTSPTATAEKNMQREARQQMTKPSKPKKPHIANSEANSCSLNRGRRSNEDQPDIGTTASGIYCDHNDTNDIMQDNDRKSRKYQESVNNSTVKTKTSKHQERHISNSEYMERFKAPSKCDYINNAWNAQKSENVDMQEILRDDAQKGDWYSEVLDLRRRASEYRHRTQNTDHMGQLLGDETQLWEDATPNNLAAAEKDPRYMRPAGITYNRYYLRKPVDPAEIQKLSSNPAPESQMTLEDVTNDADADSDDSELEEADANHTRAVSETGTLPVAYAEEMRNNGGAISSQIEGNVNKPSVNKPSVNEPSVGRVPTPEFDEQRIKRHHLDRTTPIKGNLLITPPRPYQKAEAEYYPFNSSERACTLECRNNSASEPEMKPKHCVKRCALPSTNNCLPTFGKPSKDTHILRAQENTSNSSISPPKTSFVQQSQTLSRDTSNITARPDNKRPKKSLFSKQHPTEMKMDNPVPKTITDPKVSAPAETPARHKQNDKTHLEKDFLSQSLESNHSLASEIFERTRKRLNFW